MIRWVPSAALVWHQIAGVAIPLVRSTLPLVQMVASVPSVPSHLLVPRPRDFQGNPSRVGPRAELGISSSIFRRGHTAPRAMRLAPVVMRPARMPLVC
mmetsp:Transcript_34600/g.74650  ORF Transcript_34600/g.74650 Transcript_34600/m.74650 type:complete len:98 (-) Transcript_34600:890-1183(-)